MKSKIVFELRQGLLVVRVREIGKANDKHFRLSMHRLFRNGDLWTESRRFGPDDMPLLRHLMSVAHTWIIEQRNSKT